MTHPITESDARKALSVIHCIEAHEKWLEWANSTAGARVHIEQMVHVAAIDLIPFVEEKLKVLQATLKDLRVVADSSRSDIGRDSLAAREVKCAT